MRFLIVFLFIALNLQCTFGWCYQEWYWESPEATNRSWRLGCQAITFDGRPVEEILQEQRVGDIPPSQIDYYELASSADSFSIALANGNVIFTENTLRNFTKLKSLDVSHDYKGIGSISIPPSAVRDSSDLRRIVINGFVLSNETMQMLESMKDRLNHLVLIASKAPGLMDVISNFTNLTTLHVGGRDDSRMCDPASFPRSIFQKSAATLTLVKIAKCPVEKITYEMFRSLRRLKTLGWSMSNMTEIESGAFDDLENLEDIDFLENQITTLPDGLFKNNRKLKHVGFRFQTIDNLSSTNFTHLENPQELLLVMDGSDNESHQRIGVMPGRVG